MKSGKRISTTSCSSTWPPCKPSSHTNPRIGATSFPSEERPHKSSTDSTSSCVCSYASSPLTFSRKSSKALTILLVFLPSLTSVFFNNLRLSGKLPSLHLNVSDNRCKELFKTLKAVLKSLSDGGPKPETPRALQAPQSDLEDFKKAQRHLLDTLTPEEEKYPILAFF